MIGKLRLGPLIRQNYLQLIFVFMSFALMTMTAYFFIGRIVRGHLLDSAHELLYSAEANVKAGLSETETTLLNSYHIVQDMIERDASRDEILDYLTITTDWMKRREQGLFLFNGVYGYIRGEFYDGIGWNPGNDFIPQTRLWYQTGIRSGNNVAYTAPYQDSVTGNTIVSAVRTINTQYGESAGILAVDFNTAWFEEYVNLLALTKSGYGMLISQNMTVMAHRDLNFMGLQLHELGISYEEIVTTLRNSGEVLVRRINDSDGVSVIVFFREIFNGWYVGIVTPYFEFYENLYISALILIILGLAFSFSLSFILLRLSAAKVRSDEENKAKSSFLARMSHEIRTPMNAITGMAELLLRSELSEKSRAYAQDIKQAASNLIAIINDILDLSKIEAGGLEIVPVKYLLPSLVNDAGSIIKMRLMEKPIRFCTNIDGNLPNGLFGDEVRLRQIILNLLSNAAKYTERGHISLFITVEKKEGKKIWIKIAVEDSGHGIKNEDQDKLFGDFVQVDTKRNRAIEGTGLGLAITKRLCIAMGGDISIQSEYGKGSTFTAIVLQEIDSDEPFASVEEPEKKKVLVYEGRAVYAETVCWSLEKMRVSYTAVTNIEDFAEALYREEWSFVFSGYGLYDRIRPLLEKENSAFAGGKKPPLALMLDFGTEAYISGVRFIPLPVQSLSIANVLNGKENIAYSESTKTFSGIRFTVPTARLLVVDDIATNLRVAEGLLAPYNAMVVSCLTGVEAIELVRQQDYDIVFMDHMMPVMDGIEATAAIRALEGNRFKTLPIIALTANAVSGMREMFLEKGFSGFLAKPIDISKLDEALARWIPNEKKVLRKKEQEIGDRETETGLQSLIIPGIDTKKGIAMTGGSAGGYLKVLAMYQKDAVERLPLLKKTPDEQTLPAFVTQVHALKSASASIGADELSAEAARLEAAGKAGDLAFIKKALPGFAEQLEKLAASIKNGGNPQVIIPQSLVPDPRSLEIIPCLRELEAALNSQNTANIDRLLDDLARKPFDSQTKEILDKISDNVLVAEFGEAIRIIGEFIDNMEKREEKHGN